MDMAICTDNASTWEEEDEFKASLGYIRKACLKREKGKEGYYN